MQKMFRNLFSKIKKHFQIYTGKKMLIDKEGELWMLNEKEEAINVSEEENKSKDSPIDTKN